MDHYNFKIEKYILYIETHFTDIDNYFHILNINLNKSGNQSGRTNDKNVNFNFRKIEKREIN